MADRSVDLFAAPPLANGRWYLLGYLFVLALTWITLTTATLRLTDYSHADYMPVMDGDVTIWDEHGYLGHTTNITSYETYADETRRTLDLFAKDHMKKLLNTDLGHIETLIDTLKVHHRHARSINLLGSALKVIAGTPDFDDWEQIKFRQGQLVESENGQVEINTKFQTRLNEITRTLNMIRKTDDTDTEHLYEIILAKNRIIINNLEDLIFSITLAKINLISPLILDSVDVKQLANEHLTNISIADILEVSSIKAFQNSDMLHFLIKYPVPKLVCKKINIYPVQHRKIILDLENSSTVADCGAQTFAVSECDAALSTTFCKRLQTPTCAQQLVSGTVAHCVTRPGYLEPVTLVDEGILIINDATIRVEDSNGISQLVTGTYLATYDDRIYLNGTLYVNHRGALKKKPAVSASSQINVTSHREHLSLPFLHDLSLKNLQHIGNLQTELTSRPILSSCLTLAIALLCYGGICAVRRYLTRKRQIEHTAPLRETEEGFHLTPGGVNTRRIKYADQALPVADTTKVEVKPDTRMPVLSDRCTDGHETPSRHFGLCAGSAAGHRLCGME